MDPLWKVIIGSGLLFLVLVSWIYWELHKRNAATHNKLDGIRVRLERAADEIALAHEKERAESKKLRLSIYQQFKEWLAHMRDKP